MKVILSDLPLSVQRQIPYSIRSKQNEYELDDLPPKERELVSSYLTKTVDVEYRTVYDLKPKISKYADYYTCGSVKETVVEYFKNYFYTLPGDYPFDPAFGCKLKYHLQTRDTQLRNLLVSEEIRRIANILSNDIGINITVENISISTASQSTYSEYNCSLTIKIPGEESITLNIENFS